MKGAVLEESNMAGVNLRVCNARFANLQNCTLRYRDISYIPTFSTRLKYLKDAININRGAVLAGADLEVNNTYFHRI